MYFSLKYLISLSGSMYGCVGKQKISLCDVKRVVMGEPTKDKNVDLNKNIFARFVFVWTFGAWVRRFLLMSQKRRIKRKKKHYFIAFNSMKKILQFHCNTFLSVIFFFQFTEQRVELLGMRFVLTYILHGKAKHCSWRIFMWNRIIERMELENWYSRRLRIMPRKRIAYDLNCMYSIGIRHDFFMINWVASTWHH